MANAPFTPFAGDFESLARQYWNTWNELLGRGGTLDGWGLAGGLPPGLGRMDPGAYDWYQRMQRLAADFSGGGQPADIASAWREMLGGQGADPFAGMLRSMHGGLAGGDWLEQMRPLLDMLLRPLRQQTAEWLQRPAFGPAREHQERLQALALAWQDWEQRNEAFTALLAKAGQGAFERFERLLEAHDAPGKRLESARALFDLWIDAAEEAWAEIAMSAEYRHAYAEMTNALMRLRLGLQREVEQFGALLGMPGRGELDALHRKVADLERALHAVRRGTTATAKAGAAPAARGRAAPAARAATEPATGIEPASAADRPAPPVHKLAARGNSAAARRASPARKSPPAERPVPARSSAATGSPSGRAAASRAGGAQIARRKPAAPRTAAAASAEAKAPPARRRAIPAKTESASSLSVRTAAAGRTKTGAVAAKRKPVRAQAGTAGTSAKAKASAAAAAKPPSPRTPRTSRPSLKERASAARQAKETTAAVAAPTPAPATKKPASAAPRHAPAQAAAKRAPQASTATARKAKVAKAGGTRRASAPVASGASPGTAKVVSMKDWVSRNLAAAQPGADAPGGKRGGRNR